MYPIATELKVGNNQLDSYLPVRNKNNDISWQFVTGLALSYALKRKIEAYDPDQFREDCKTHMQELLDEPAFWSVLERMYFSSQDIFRVSPLFLLFHAQFVGEKISAGSTADKRLGTLFANLMGDFSLRYPIQDRLNFIEQQMLNKLNEKIKLLGKGPFAEEQPYLPYMVTCFQSDLAFLAEHPQYLLQELTNTLRLYAFSWCAQLALNLDNWQDGEPQSKSLFFILDSEKASSEREKVKRYGYRLFASQSEKLFPILSALEVLQVKGAKKRPLWQVYQDCLNYSGTPNQVLDELNDYIQKFISKEERDLPARERATNLENAFKQLLSVAVEQFQGKKTDRATVNRKYVNELENQICTDFLQVRGRAGKVLVLNQDRLLLLTNLTVGKNDKLRLHELLRGFEQRGFYLDNQSAQTLVAFYERMGNVERMSDSGDAVYVRKTV
ncbi:DNA phosphorothioation-dependent restriction protein DptG [Salmonella enterica]|uniref:DNA phosphorothioation-dependent restriction protein DptG n=1 Tax=Salmonella enterica subsp. houtenae serovar 18:z36,z38:- TaxID=2577510 RepID=A0A729Q9L1_SALHO|nr:DNA phosphorothioation-dependent restriction protein DptG [Salmonella enterica]ECC1641621.1 DNA phosphorothioation-dependent restriction protein DptG [Salmonella enterica subsp. houtenae]MBA2162994.1 DNA phosphorothioation-dependent restriction protein DptG [Salmonella enterica subsp. houtenae serovar 18:z36,z38:-]EBD0801581.1 DNA phosphorothioation-dependent restriction protein DptG [Salmonella enterica]EEP9800645.1 DNA phosphorothioation-dependent restriction protein DptG [Salmonella enter